jgi:uncharacterized protein YggU (UPF0235/DUF167 family)
VSDRASPLSDAPDGIRVAVRVAPKSAADRIGDIAAAADGGAALKVAVTAAPERGKANTAVVRLLAKAWGVPKSTITVTAGAADRRKTLHVAGEPAALRRKIETWLRERS